MPLYESEADRARQSLFLHKIVEAFGIRAQLLPIQEQLDFSIYKNGKIIGYGEIKNLTCTSEAYTHSILARHKWNYFVQNLQCGNPYIRFYYFLRYSDCDKYACIESIEGYGQKVVQSKNHADDPLDAEWLVFVPRDKFTIF